MKRNLFLIMALMLVPMVSGCGSAGIGSPDTFIGSDDYKEGEEIVGVVLDDADYAKMVEDIERHGHDFNWGWVKATTGSAAEPKDLAFDMSSYKTVRVVPVENKAMKVAPGIEEAATEALVQAMELLDLEAVTSGPADLELEAAIVDYKSDKTYIYVGFVDPFLEMEGRLKDLDTGETLFLFRHQEHGTTPASAATDLAGQIANFLR